MTDHKARDAYFTRPHVARRVWALALRHCRATGLDPGAVHWIEPSAGAGVFLDTAPSCVKRLTAYDIEPMAAGIERRDFLLTTPPPDDMPRVVIGNPPFGRQGYEVGRFVGQALRVWQAEFACFVSPNLMTHDFGKRRLLRNIAVLKSIRIAGDTAFVLPCGKPYKLGAPCVGVVYGTGMTAPAPAPAPAPADFRLRGVMGGKSFPPGYACGVSRVAVRPIFLTADDIAAAPATLNAIIIYPAAAAADTLRDRFAAIDWSAVKAERIDAGNPFGTINKRHVIVAYVAAYGERYGDARFAPEQTRLFS